MRTRKLISNNIKYSAIARAVGFAVDFALLPFIVSHVGKEMYGAYILVLTFTGYLGVLDFGVQSAVIKYVAELRGRGDPEGTNKVIGASFTFYTVIGVVAAILIFILSFFFASIFRVEEANMVMVRHLLWIAAAASLFVWPGRTFDGVLEGLQRYDWRAIIAVAASLLTGASAYVIFTTGGSMTHFMAASYLIMILRYLSAYILGNLRLLKAKLLFPCFDRQTFRIIFSFSLFVFLGNLVGIVIFHLGDVIIGALVSVSAVALYAVAYTLQNAFRTVNSLLGAPLLPASAEMEGKESYQAQKSLLLKGTKYMTLVFVPMVIIAVIFAEPLIDFWMGSSFRESVPAAQVLMAFWLFSSTIEVGSGLLTAKGYVKVKFQIAAANAALNLTLSLILVRYLGILGVALGTTIGMMVIEVPLISYNALKVLNTTYREYFNSAIRPNLKVYLLAAILSLLLLIFFRPDSLIRVLLYMGLVYSISLLSGFVLSLSSAERREIWALAKF